MAETYSCATELSAYGRAGELEQQVYVRQGRAFLRSGRLPKPAEALIFRETQTDIAMYELIDGNERSGFLISIINKRTLTFVMKFLVVDDKDMGNQIYLGKCLKT